jgi:hypothetical protein
MRWILPEYIDDILPAEAMRIETPAPLDSGSVFQQAYELVMPPLIEYTDSLLTGTGHDLELRTFKVVDQISGRMMGLRADITPQVARIDAHLLNREGVTRLCYCGSVLHTRPAGPRRRASRSSSAPSSTATRGSRPTWRSCGCCARRSSSAACATRASTSATWRCSAPSPRGAARRRARGAAF